MKHLKNIGLWLVYLLAYQFALACLIIGATLPTLPTSQMQVFIWFGFLVGFISSVGLIYLLYKVVYVRPLIHLGAWPTWLRTVWFPLLAYVLLLLIEWFFPFPSSDNQKMVEAVVKLTPLTSFFAVVVFAPILEELLFRGILASFFFPKMEKIKSYALYLGVSSFLFSLAHGPATLPQFFIYFAMGAIFAWLYLVKGLRYAMACHIFNNALGFYLILYG